MAIYEFEHIQTGANAAIQFISAAAGWTVPVDGADADGIEMNHGVIAGRDLSFTVGTDPAFFIQVTMLVDLIASQDVYGVGFRKQGVNVDITTPSLMASVYDDKAIIGVNDNAGNLVTITSIGGTDTTTELAHAVLANATWLSMRVNVSGAGAVTYTLGTSLVSAAAAKTALAADASAVAMTITDGIILTPYMPFVSTGTLCDIDLVEYEVGWQ